MTFGLTTLTTPKKRYLTTEYLYPNMFTVKQERGRGGNYG